MHRKNGRLFHKSLTIAGLLLLTFLESVAGAVPKVKVGVLMPLTGDFAYVGEIARKSILAAVPSGDIEFIFEDSACDAKKALSGYRKLLEMDGARMFLGPCCGNELESIAPLLEKNGSLVMSLCSSTGELFMRSNGRIISPVFSIEAESQFNGDYLESEGYQNIAIVYFDSAFSVAHETAFKRTLVRAKASTYKFDKLDQEAVRDISLKLRRDAPDAIYVPDFTPFALSFARQLKRIGLGNIPLFSIHAVQTESLIGAEGSAADGIVYSHPDIGSESADAYYPARAASLLNSAIKYCGDSVSCVKQQVLGNSSLTKDGTMEGTLVLKTVKNGKFVRFLKTTGRH